MFSIVAGVCARASSGVSINRRLAGGLRTGAFTFKLHVKKRSNELAGPAFCPSTASHHDHAMLMNTVLILAAVRILSRLLLDVRHGILGHVHAFSKLVLQQPRRAYAHLNYARCGCCVLFRGSERAIDWLTKTRLPVTRVLYQHEMYRCPVLL